MTNRQELLAENDVADLLNISVRTLQSWRVTGAGPRFRKLGRSVRYTRADVDAFVAGASRSSTAEVA